MNRKHSQEGSFLNEETVIKYTHTYKLSRKTELVIEARLAISTGRAFLSRWHFSRDIDGMTQWIRQQCVER